MTRPLIGITSEMAAAGWNDRVREAVLLPASYAWALQRAGCIPVLLPPAPYGAIGLVARLDAVLFSDGRDIDPRRGGDGAVRPDNSAAGSGERAAEPDLVRDAGEFALMRAAIAARLPLLAVGRGMRVLNAVRGGTVTEAASTVPGARAGSATNGGVAAAGARGSGIASVGARNSGAAASTRTGATSGGTSGGAATDGAAARSAVRQLRISPSSRLDRVLGTSIGVTAAAWPSGRHQDVDRLGGGLSAVAWTGDETVVAVELTGHPFAIGLAWHPEQDEDLRIFEALRAAAAARRDQAA